MDRMLSLLAFRCAWEIPGAQADPPQTAGVSQLGKARIPFQMRAGVNRGANNQKNLANEPATLAGPAAHQLLLAQNPTTALLFLFEPFHGCVREARALLPLLPLLLQ